MVKRLWYGSVLHLQVPKNEFVQFCPDLESAIIENLCFLSDKFMEINFRLWWIYGIERLIKKTLKSPSSIWGNKPSRRVSAPKYEWLTTDFSRCHCGVWIFDNLFYQFIVTMPRDRSFFVSTRNSRVWNLQITQLRSCHNLTHAEFINYHLSRKKRPQNMRIIKTF